VRNSDEKYSHQGSQVNLTTRRKIVINKRRIFIGAMTSLVALTLLTGCRHNKILGLVLGGGGNWTAIVKDGKEGLTTLASATAILLHAQADLAEALGFKQEAALLRGDAKNLEEKGEDISGADIEGAGKNSAAVQSKLNKKLMESGKLDAKTAAAVGSAAKKMIPALGKIAKGVGILVKVGSSISSAGSPSPTDLPAVGIAAQIPPLLPKAAQAIPEVFSTVNDFRKVAAEKNIAMPEVPAAPGFS
jgi:hypothetical protein